MKHFLILLSFLLIPFNAFAKLKVVTTLPDLASLVQSVGKDLVDVKSIARGDQDPHFLEAKPSYAVLLNQADLLIEVGLDLESGWLPLLMTQSRNPNIQVGQKGYLNASEGLEILEIPTGNVDRSMGDVHPNGNPHYWLDPRNGLYISSRIAKKLGELDPANAAQYSQNQQAFQNQLKNKIDAWSKQLLSIRGKKIITHHKSFSYFVNWASLQGVGYVELKPGIPPSPSHLLSLIDLIKRDHIPLIITENYYDTKPSKQIAEKTGAKLLILPTSVGGEPTVKTYEELFEFLINKIKEAL